MAQQYSAEQMIEAIKAANGIIATAARRLGCDRSTVYAYINKYKTVAAARDEARETTLDWVESKLMEQIGVGNMTAIIFYLKTQGKQRGYIERVDHDLTSGGEKLNIQISYDDSNPKTS